MGAHYATIGALEPQVIEPPAALTSNNGSWFTNADSAARAKPVCPTGYFLGHGLSTRWGRRPGSFVLLSDLIYFRVFWFFLFF